MFYPHHGNDLILGHDAAGRTITLTKEQRSTHLYITGTTGTGKSKFLEHLIRQDIKNWRVSKSGLLVIDPHGSLYDSLMEWMAFMRLDRPVIPIDLRNTDRIVAYNMLRHRPNADPAVIVANFVQAMAYVWGQSGTSETPLFARWAGNVLRTLYETKQTLVEAEYLIDHAAVNIRRSLAQQVKTVSVQRDWRLVEGLSPIEFENQVSSTINRLRRFLATEMLRSMFGQTEISLDLGKALNEGHIILVNLAPKGLTIIDEDASLFATLLLSDIWTAAKDRGKSGSRHSVKPFYLYLDEFQRFLAPSISQSLDEARGYGLHLSLSHQYPNQLINAGVHGKAIYDSVMANARSKVVFQMEGEENLKPLVNSLFMGTINLDEIKHELYSTKIMGHQKEIRRSITRSTSVSEGSTEGTGQKTHYDGTVSDWTSEQSSSSRATGSGHSETEMEVDAAVFGKELSSVQFRSLEEHKFRAMAALFSQPNRTFITRRTGERQPIIGSVPKVEGYFIRPTRIQEYATKCAKKWQFLLPADEAKAKLQARTEALMQSVALPSGEPKTARRRI